MVTESDRSELHLLLYDTIKEWEYRCNADLDYVESVLDRELRNLVNYVVD